jgi:hypothetical protein
MGGTLLVRPKWWRLGAVIAGLSLAALPAAVPNRPPELSQVGKPGELEAARILEQFRQAGIAGSFYLAIELRSLPRRGEERIFPGRLWGGREASGPVFRLEVEDGQGGSRRLILRNGVEGGVWRWAGSQVEQVAPAGAVAPLFPGVEVSAFDLQMPFLYWPEAQLEKLARAFGRPAYSYLFKSPPGFLAQGGGFAAARAYLDTQFNALMQTELVAANGSVLKTFYLVSLKKVGEQYVPRQADYRNEVTRDKTRFQVTGAALNLSVPAGAFAPASLAEAWAPPAAALILPVE